MKKEPALFRNLPDGVFDLVAYRDAIAKLTNWFPAPSTVVVRKGWFGAEPEPKASAE